MRTLITSCSTVCAVLCAFVAPPRVGTAQTEQVTCERETIESPINVKEVLPFVAESLRAQAERDFNSWNFQAASLVEKTSNLIY